MTLDGIAARAPSQSTGQRLIPATGGLRAGVAEDSPNGGGNRALLFNFDSDDGRYSLFLHNSASAVICTCRSRGLWRAARQPAPRDGRCRVAIGGLVDRHRRPAGCAVGRAGGAAEGPLPIHWDGLWEPFEAGLPWPFAESELEAYLAKSGIRLPRRASTWTSGG